MSNLKQQAIIEAYKALGMNVPETADENGWTGVSVFQLAHVQESFCETRKSGHTCLARPVLLEGLEDNRGWLSINNESDLPKTSTGLCWVYLKDGTIYYADSKLLISKEMRLYWLSTVQAYQPIVKPSAPLY